MAYRPLEGYIDFPAGILPEDPHIALCFDYEFAGKRMGEEVSLLIHSWVIDHMNNIFTRRASYILSRVDAVDCISLHIRNHLIAMGLEDMSCRRLMRNFEVDPGKAVAYDLMEFNKIVR